MYQDRVKQWLGECFGASASNRASDSVTITKRREGPKKRTTVIKRASAEPDPGNEFTGLRFLSCEYL
jgi:hypothetical protein